MLEQRAIVTRTDDCRVYIKSLQSSACGHCSARESCGTSVYAKWLPDREMALSSTLALNAGDQVIVGIEESHLLRASLLMYLLPLLVMLLAVGLFEDSEQDALLALCSLGVGLYLVHRLQQRFTRHFIGPPQIIRKL